MDHLTAKGAGTAPSDRVRILRHWKYPAAEVISQSSPRIGAERDALAADHECGVGPDAVMLDRGANRIVLVAHAGCTGVATEEVARRWKSQFVWWEGYIDIVTAFGYREEFSLLAKMQAWGSYTWFEAEPDHIMHFGESVYERDSCSA